MAGRCALVTPETRLSWFKYMLCRGVIYGWDRNCQRDIEWARQVEVEHGQPFYRILPDELDCQRLFGSPRSNKYALLRTAQHSCDINMP